MKKNMLLGGLMLLSLSTLIHSCKSKAVATTDKKEIVNEKKYGINTDQRLIYFLATHVQTCVVENPVQIYTHLNHLL